MISFLEDSIYLECNKCNSIIRGPITIIGIDFVKRNLNKKHYCGDCILERALLLNKNGTNKYVF